MDMLRNAFKHAIAKGQLQIGLWCSLCSPVAIEVVSHSGYDWLLLDTEHSPNDVTDILGHLQAAQSGTASCIVRPAWNDMVLIKRYLDIGAQTLLLPFVQTPEEAKRAVESTRYPPKGVRGITGSGRASRYGRVKDYLKNASSEICVLVQVETRRSLDAIEEIAAVEGVDGIFIGPADLSADFGRHNKWAEPEIWNAILDAGRRIKAAGKAAGFLSGIEKECRGVLDAGFGFVAVGSDTGLLARQTEALVRMYKG